MKLGRPDVFHPRIVFAGDPDVDERGGDDAGLVAALRARGLHARWLAWDDPDTLRADVVILRTVQRPSPAAGFAAWTRRVPALLNHPDVIAWNTDEHYLRDLDWAGVPTLSSRRRGRAVRLESTALVFFGGAQAYAFNPVAQAEVEDLDFELWDVGRAALQAVATRVGIPATELLCARAEVVGGPGEVRLASLDLVAPALGWSLLSDYTRDVQQREFALAVESAVDRLGLGPFSHRRP